MASPPKVVSVSAPNGVVPQDGGQKKAAARTFEARLVANEGDAGAFLKVKAGDTLAKIARQAGVELSDLLAANPQFDAASVDGVHNWSRKAHGKRDADDLRLGERINVPVATNARTAKAPVSPSQIEARAVQVKINEAPVRKASVEAPSTTVETGVSTAKTAQVNTQPDPVKPPDPVLEVKAKDYGHLLMMTAGGSGSKDPRSADNRVGINLESLDNSVNPNNGTYQFGSSLTFPGRVQEPQSRLDATARMTLFSLGRKPLKVTDSQGKEQSVETFGVKLGSMRPENRFASVSAYANLSGLPIGAITQENGAAVSGKSATSPAHLGVAASLGSLNAHYAWGLGNGQVRNTADNTMSFRKTDIYGVDMAVPFNFDGKVKLDKAHFGVTGRRTVTTPENGTPGKPIYASSAFVESYFKINAGKMNSLLPGQASSSKVDAVGIFRAKVETPMGGKIDPKLTLRYDQPLWEVRNTTMGADGKLEVRSQLRVEAMTAAQVGLNSENRAALQNLTFGLRARF